MKILLKILFGLGCLFLTFKLFKSINLNPNYQVGEVIDHFNGVEVYYNGGVSNTEGREITLDGYNLGLKYQCVEFIKRYYYQKLNHKMPDSYGNAIDFFDFQIKDGENNFKRNLKQYCNPSSFKPKVDDILIFNKTLFNRFGHVAIVTKVEKDIIEIIQQNPGPYVNSRETYFIEFKNNLWYINNDRILGRLSKD